MAARHCVQVVGIGERCSICGQNRTRQALLFVLISTSVALLNDSYGGESFPKFPYIISTASTNESVNYLYLWFTLMIKKSGAGVRRYV